MTADFAVGLGHMMRHPTEGLEQVQGPIIEIGPVLGRALRVMPPARRSSDPMQA